MTQKKGWYAVKLSKTTYQPFLHELLFLMFSYYLLQKQQQELCDKIANHPFLH